DLIELANVVTGAAFWPAVHAPELLETWLGWCASAPRTATTTFRVMSLPPVPEVPAPLRGRTTVCVDGAVLATGGDPETAARDAEPLLDALRTRADPLVDGWAAATPREVPDAHLDPTEPYPVVGDHLLLAGFDVTAAGKFLQWV